jgi:CHAD domain-containing protein
VSAAIAGDDGEGVHDARVASRRLRAAMDVAAGCFPSAWYRPLRRLAREITGALAEVRDRDVTLELFIAERQTSPPEEQSGIDRLIERMSRERVEARERLLAFLTDLRERGASAETARRFGPAEAAP